MTEQFISGMQALQDAIEEGKRKADASRTYTGGKTLNFLGWKEGEKKIIRFIADDLITADFYDFIIDNTGSTKTFMVDKTDPDRLKRYMSPTPGIGWQKRPGGPIEEPKPRQLSVCVAVLRQEVQRDGKLVVEDYIYEREAGGKTYPSRYFGIVQQSGFNFWPQLIACFKKFGTICDRDYEISRSGTSFDTKYAIIPLSPIDELSDLDTVKKFYSYGEPWNSDDPQRALKCPMTTLEWAQYFAGEERYQHWLTPDGAKKESGLAEFSKETTTNPDEAQTLPPASTTTGTFASLQEQLINAAKKK